MRHDEKQNRISCVAIYCTIALAPACLLVGCFDSADDIIKNKQQEWAKNGGPPAALDTALAFKKKETDWAKSKKQQLDETIESPSKLIQDGVNNIASMSEQQVQALLSNPEIQSAFGGDGQSHQELVNEVKRLEDEVKAAREAGDQGKVTELEVDLNLARLEQIDRMSKALRLSLFRIQKNHQTPREYHKSTHGQMVIAKGNLERAQDESDKQKKQEIYDAAKKANDQNIAKHNTEVKNLEERIEKLEQDKSKIQGKLNKNPVYLQEKVLLKKARVNRIGTDAGQN